MVRTISYISILILSTFLTVRGQSNQWVEKIEAVDLKNVNALEDSGGNLFIAGSFKDSLLLIGEEEYLLGKGPNNMFLAKFDSNRSLVKRKMYFSSYEFNINLVENLEQDDEGNIYLTGKFYQDFSSEAGDTLLYTIASLDPLIAKFDTELNLKWIHRFGGSNNTDVISDIDILSDGSILISGKLNRRFDYDLKGSEPVVVDHSNSGNPIVVLYDKDRNLQWIQQIENTGGDWTVASVANEQQEVYSATYNSDTTNINIDGAVTTEIARGVSDVIITKRSTEGELLWVKYMGGAGKDDISSMVIDASGAIYVLLQTPSPDFQYDDKVLSLQGIRDLVLMKLDGSGNVLWLNQIPKTALGKKEQRLYIQGSELVLTGDFGTEMILNTRGESLDMDLIAGQDFEARYDLDGNILSTQSIAGGVIRQRNDLRLLENGSWLASAPLFGTANFNPLPEGKIEKGLLDTWTISKYCTPPQANLLINYICEGDSTKLQLDPSAFKGQLYSPLSEERWDIDPVLSLPKSNTSYLLALTDESGCTNYSFINLSVIECTTTSTKELGQGVMSMYPNPTKDVVKLVWPSMLEVEFIVVYDLAGRVVQKTQVNPKNQNLTMNIEELMSGTYVVRLSGRDFTITEKLVKQ